MLTKAEMHQALYVTSNHILEGLEAAGFDT